MQTNIQECSVDAVSKQGIHYTNKQEIDELPISLK